MEEVEARELKKGDYIDWGHGLRTKVVERSIDKRWVVVLHKRADYGSNLRFAFRPTDIVTRLPGEVPPPHVEK